MEDIISLLNYARVCVCVCKGVGMEFRRRGLHEITVTEKDSLALIALSGLCHSKRAQSPQSRKTISLSRSIKIRPLHTHTHTQTSRLFYTPVHFNFSFTGTELIPNPYNGSFILFSFFLLKLTYLRKHKHHSNFFLFSSWISFIHELCRTI